MIRRFACAGVVTLLTLSVALAEEFTANVSKIEGGKITFTKGGFGGGFGKGKGKDAKKPEPITLDLASNVKYLKAKAAFNAEDKKLNITVEGNLEGGKEAFEKLVKENAAKKKEDPDKKGKGKFGGFGGGGTTVQLVTEGEGDKAKVTEIRVYKLEFKKKDAN